MRMVARMMIEANNEYKPIFFREGESSSCNSLFADVQKAYYTKENDRKVHFTVCGFLVVNDRPVVIFPKNFPMSKEDNIENAKTLFKTFARYISRKSKSRGWLESNTSEFMDEFEGDAITCINDILYILDDFKRNGYLVRRHDAISQTRPGRVMWNKTMKKITPVISHRQVIYPLPYMKSRVRHDEEMIQKIHRYLVDKFRHQWGWLVNMEGKTSEPQAPCTDEEAKKYIATELRACFVQREIDLLRRMLRYYRKKIGKNTKTKSEYMLTKEFEYIWEDVCGFCFGNMSKDYKNKLVPVANFEPAEDINIEEEKKWHQRPDILCEVKGENRKKIYILDAKYYALIPKEAPSDKEEDIAKISNFPSWGDMAKQFMYFYTISKKIKNPTFSIGKNILLFPGNNAQEKKFAGTVSIPNIDGLGSIELWWLNVKYMLELYVAHTKIDNIEDFFNIDNNKNT